MQLLKIIRMVRNRIHLFYGIARSYGTKGGRDMLQRKKFEEILGFSCKYRTNIKNHEYKRVIDLADFCDYIDRFGKIIKSIFSKF